MSSELWTLGYVGGAAGVVVTVHPTRDECIARLAGLVDPQGELPAGDDAAVLRDAAENGWAFAITEHAAPDVGES